jgi:hypothetical protein
MSRKFLINASGSDMGRFLCAVLVIASVRSWLAPGGMGMVRRIHLSLLGLAAIAMIMALSFSNYIGVNLP